MSPQESCQVGSVRKQTILRDAAYAGFRRDSASASSSLFTLFNHSCVRSGLQNANLFTIRE